MEVNQYDKTFERDENHVSVLNSFEGEIQAENSSFINCWVPSQLRQQLLKMFLTKTYPQNSY